MLKLLLLFSGCLFFFSADAQKNLVPVQQTSLLDLPLPAASKQDKRFLSVGAAKILFETETKKAGLQVVQTEVYLLPAVNVYNYTSDSLTQMLLGKSFQTAAVEGDNKLRWVQGNNKTYIVYFSAEKRETDLYIAECNGNPVLATGTPVQMGDQTFPNNTNPPNTAPVQQIETVNNTNTSTNNATSQPLTGGYTFTTSNFDDGWIATLQNDWVLVQKNNQSVYLYYAVTYNSDWFSGTGVMERDYYWDNYVAKQFQVEQKQYKDDGEFVSSLKPKYVEGWGVDPQTGERRFLAMTLSISPNAAQLTVAAYSDEQTFRSQFPKANDKYTSDLTNMHRYNKFAIGTGDVTGTWQSGGSQMTQWYDARTGNYAGATFASSSATFSFMDNGTYSSIHNGATGSVGAMNSFQQEYKGKYSISNWNIKATNRFQGRTDSFDAHFQAVRAGRLLYLNDQRGGSYLLVKIK